MVLNNLPVCFIVCVAVNFDLLLNSNLFVGSKSQNELESVRNLPELKPEMCSFPNSSVSSISSVVCIAWLDTKSDLQPTQQF